MEKVCYKNKIKWNIMQKEQCEKENRQIQKKMHVEVK